MASPPSSSNPAEPTANPLLELSGTLLESRYELGRVLGAGGMGAVFEAKQLRLGRMVAIKVLRPAFAGHEEYIKRFRREARIASEIRHRNVVEVYDFGEAAHGLIYSVMELLEGQDLECLLAKQPQRRLPWDQALGLLLQIASGLRAAHAAGIIHRDIKPANCFLVEGDEGEPLVKVVDFGIAKATEGEDAERITSTAEVLGTPCYMAPELVVSKSPATPRSDVYSLGVLAYRMLAGHVPFSGATSFQVLHRACYEPVPPLRAHAPDVPPAIEALVLRMLAKTPEKRPADMQEVRAAIVALLESAPVARPIAIPASAALMLDPPKDAETVPQSPSPGAGRRSEPRPPRKRAKRVQLELSAQGEIELRAAVQPGEAPAPVGPQSPPVAPARGRIPASARAREPPRVDLPTTAPSRSRLGVLVGVVGVAFAFATGALVLWTRFGPSAVDHEASGAASDTELEPEPAPASPVGSSTLEPDSMSIAGPEPPHPAEPMPSATDTTSSLDPEAEASTFTIDAR